MFGTGCHQSVSNYLFTGCRTGMNPSTGKPYNLDYDRTCMSADQTLMSWIRTSVSMIGFGFTIFRFFMYMQNLVSS